MNHWIITASEDIWSITASHHIHIAFTKFLRCTSRCTSLSKVQLVVNHPWQKLPMTVGSRAGWLHDLVVDVPRCCHDTFGYRKEQRLHTTLSHKYGYGSIPINTIFSGMNIHKSQLFWCEQKGYKVLTHCHIVVTYIRKNLSPTYLCLFHLFICWKIFLRGVIRSFSYFVVIFKDKTSLHYLAFHRKT